MGRIIGVRYRVKETKNQEARPTMVLVKDVSFELQLELKTEDDELDFSDGKLPVSWGTVGVDEDISVFHQRHCKWRKVKRDEDVSLMNPSHLRQVETGRGIQTEFCTDVPVQFEGLKAGDAVAMAMGAGNILAGLFFMDGQRVGARVHRIPPMHLDKNRLDPDKNQDHKNLVLLLQQKSGLFYEVRQPDKDLIEVANVLDLREQAQDARIAYGNRLIQRLRIQVYLGARHELKGTLKERCEAMMLDDEGYQRLLEEEKKADKELARVVSATRVWQVLEPIPGVGPRIAAGIIGPVQDIRRFTVSKNDPKVLEALRRWMDRHPDATEEERHQWQKRKAQQMGAAKLMKFCGVHTIPKDSNDPQDPNRLFARHRAGEVANWHPEVRQALWLLGDQFNRKPESEWGQKLLQYKTALRAKHPEPEVVLNCDGTPKKDKKGKIVKRYTNAHILRMAKWRTLTRFVRWLYKEWVRIETVQS